jgi:hypothetical protein
MGCAQHDQWTRAQILEWESVTSTSRALYWYLADLTDVFHVQKDG